MHEGKSTDRLSTWGRRFYSVAPLHSESGSPLLLSSGSCVRVFAKYTQTCTLYQNTCQFVLRRLTEEASGDYTIAIDENHYREAVMAQCTPPPTQPGQGSLFADLVRMGFPAETQVALSDEPTSKNHSRTEKCSVFRDCVFKLLTRSHRGEPRQGLECDCRPTTLPPATTSAE